jgi:GT2 family glycosyltransferase
MDLSVITVTWNARENIVDQIKSVFLGAKNISLEEIIVDNGSTDDTIAIVKTHCNVSLPIRVIANNKNLGFGAANNLGAKIATGDFLLFLNPDMRVSPGSLDIIVNWLKQHPQVGLASCKLIDAQGNFNTNAGPRRFPRLWEMILLILKIPHFFPRVLDNYLMKNFNPEIEQEVDSVRGSFMLMRREVYEKLGWAFDPRYFIWFEDVDTCREVWKLGYKVVYTPIISCVDHVGQSFKKRNTFWKQKNFILSMLKYFKKWGLV